MSTPPGIGSISHGPAAAYPSHASEYPGTEYPDTVAPPPGYPSTMPYPISVLGTNQPVQFTPDLEQQVAGWSRLHLAPHALWRPS